MMTLHRIQDRMRGGRPDGPGWRAREMIHPQFIADSEITSLYFRIFMCSKFSKPSSHIYVIKFHQANLQGMYLFWW